MRFVVIGGDAAGMSAASRAKRLDPSMEVIVLEKTRDVSFSACGMPYNIADPDRSMNDLVVRSANVFRDKQGLDLREGHEATEIRLNERCVRGIADGTRDFSVEYDKLLIATGCSAVLPEIPGINLPGVFALRSLEDGRRIKAYLGERHARKALIMGMGYIGLEMAEAFSARGMSVEMAKTRARLLPYLAEGLADVVREELTGHGVALRFGRRFSGIEKAEDGTLRVAMEDGAFIECDMVLVGLGAAPNSQIARDAGLKTGPSGAIAVDRGMRSSDPNVYAAGDCADAFHVITGRRVWLPLALRANRAGWAVADNVVGKGVELAGIVGTSVFKVFDAQVAKTGLSADEAERAGFSPVETVIQSRTRAHAHPGNQSIHVALIGDRGTGKLLGGQLVGKEGAAHRIDTVAVALHAGMTVSEFAQCDLAYAPPFSPVWDPLLTAANQLVKSL